ncbi:hypothetical protein [Enterococcus sp. HY326]|uniref:hypothetical protein n=1 Tax=Enterococcus sp. HY326 TaxID=2971265 RepID=UPI00223EFE86|nr:hypothetical protein [Enterococcus sp. HY326]
MKKIMGLTLVCASFFVLSACGTSNDSTSSSSSETTTTSTSAATQGVTFTKGFYTSNPEKQVEIKGTADEDGTITFNNAAGEEEAVAVTAGEDFTINYDMAELGDTEVTFTFKNADNQSSSYDIKLIANHFEEE